MSYSLADIMHETRNYWVYRNPKRAGLFEVYRKEATHSVKCATFYFPNAVANAEVRAIDKCESLQWAADAAHDARVATQQKVQP